MAKIPEQKAPEAAIGDLTKPSLIQLNGIKDEAAAKEAQKQIDDWTAALQKDVSQIFEKYGVKTWQLSFIHEGTKTPILAAKGGSYITCRLAVHATKELKARVDEELAI